MVQKMSHFGQHGIASEFGPAIDQQSNNTKSQSSLTVHDQVYEDNQPPQQVLFGDYSASVNNQAHENQRVVPQRRSPAITGFPQARIPSLNSVQSSVPVIHGYNQGLIARNPSPSPFMPLDGYIRSAYRASPYPAPQRYIQPSQTQQEIDDDDRDLCRQLLTDFKSNLSQLGRTKSRLERFIGRFPDLKAEFDSAQEQFASQFPSYHEVALDNQVQPYQHEIEDIVLNPDPELRRVNKRSSSLMPVQRGYFAKRTRVDSRSKAPRRTNDELSLDSNTNTGSIQSSRLLQPPSRELDRYQGVRSYHQGRKGYRENRAQTQEAEPDSSLPPISRLQKIMRYHQVDLDEDASNGEVSDEEFFDGNGTAFEEEFFDDHDPALEDDSWPLLQSPPGEPHGDRDGMGDEAEATPTVQSPSGGRTSQRILGSRADIAIQLPSSDHPAPEEEVAPLSEGKSRRLPLSEISALATRRAQLPRKSAPAPGALKKKARGGNATGKSRLPANQIVVYPFVAWNPVQKLWADVSSISDWDTLHGIFESQYKKITRKKKYGTITRNPATYLESIQGSCIGVYIVQHSGGSSYKKSEGEERRACDSCIKAHRPCIILFESSAGVTKMGMCPLPDALRGDATWGQSVFWVHGLPDEQYTG